MGSALHVLDIAHDEGRVEQRITDLANLSSIAYDRCREQEAQDLGIRVATLDAEVERKRKEINPAQEVGQELKLPEITPHHEAVDGAELLDEMASSASRYVVLPQHGAEILALWATFTFMLDAANFAPILAITSPEKRCGKTTVLSWLLRLSWNALPSSNISSSSVFRAIEKWHPTLIIDEADSFLKDNEEMRGVLNSGHSRAMAFVVRNVESGGKIEPRQFSTWGAKAIACIGTLPDTLHDRAIELPMQRKFREQRVEKLRGAAFEELRGRCLRFAMDNADTLRTASPAIPDGLSDRAADNWEPLFAIADIAGGRWPKVARNAAVAVSGSESEPESQAVELLRDIREYLIAKHPPGSHLASRDLIAAICENEERPWATYNHGKPISPRQLARKLKAFKLQPGGGRIGARTPKGYSKSAFEDVFVRYIPATPAETAIYPQQCNNAEESMTYSAFESDTRQSVVADREAHKPLKDKECFGVAHKTAKTAGAVKV